VSIGLLFWLLMVIWLIFGAGWGWSRDRIGFGNGLIVWVVIALLGWKVFGFVIQG
jgi:hypothetical protein